MATSRQFSLKWDNHLTVVSSAFQSLRCERDLIDVTLSCEGQKIPAHKMLLSACSSYFREIFKQNPCQHPVIIFRNVAFSDLEAVVDFMYKGVVNVEDDRLGTFLNTAELLEVQGLSVNKQNISTVAPTESVDKGSKVEEAKRAADSDRALQRLEDSGEIVAVSNKRKSPQSRQSVNSVEEEIVNKLPKMSGPGSNAASFMPFEEVSFKAESIDLDEILEEPRSFDVPSAGFGNEQSSSDPLDVTESGPQQVTHADLLSIASTSSANQGNYAPGDSSENNVRRVRGRTPISANIIAREDGKFLCGFCSRVFKSRSGCQHHLDVHFGKTTCQICNKVFSQKHALKSHMAFHLGNTKCNNCHRTLLNLQDYKIHIKSCKSFADRQPL